VSRETTKALTATGPGFAVSSAWGTVQIPAEESDPSTALQLADVRMYAQKESRRLAGSIEMPDREAVEQTR
jgi:hypothetical protein